MIRILILLFPLTLFAETQTTDNLITNGTFENNNSNGWTTNGDVQVLGDCCGSSYDLEFGDSGSIEQSFNLTSDTITQPMLNNGITLNSSVLVQNGECAVAGCWGGQGGADAFTIRLQIRDIDNNVLATTTQERTNVTGINGKDFSDSVAYTGSNSNIGNIFISGTDANAPSNLGGANLDNISVTMTYDDTVLSAIQTSQISTTFTNVEETLGLTETIIPETFEEIFFIIQEPEISSIVFEQVVIEEVKTEEINTGIINVFIKPMELINEESKTFKEITTEIEIVEEIPEVREETETIEVAENSTTVSESQEESSAVEPTESNSEEVVSTESRGSTSSVEERNVATQSEESSTSVAEESTEEVITESNIEVSDDDSQSINEDVAVVDIQKIEEKINNSTSRIDVRLISFSNAVALAMKSNADMTEYGKTNQNLFNDNQILDRVLPYGYEKSYTDARNIYASSNYIDPANEFDKILQNKIDDRIRAERELERILNGY
tara:strand:+ start:1368 stop:2855 length:1488 start_codon:yes stop_codon:yes gene_type:complete